MQHNIAATCPWRQLLPLQLQGLAPPACGNPAAAYTAALCSTLTRHTTSGSALVCRSTDGARDQTQDISTGTDIRSVLVDPSFRSTPWEAERRKANDDIVRIMFVSESNSCRSPLATCIMRQLLQESSLAGRVECDSKGTRDYRVGEPAEESVVQLAQEQNLQLEDSFRSRQFDYEQDIVESDLVVVFDKFTAADVLREVSVYDTINKSGNYCLKVRLLGDFHPELQRNEDPDGRDIEDCLYHSWGGDGELELVRDTAQVIREACRGLLQFLMQAQGKSSQHTNGSAAGKGCTDAGQPGLKQRVSSAVRGMEKIDWLVPPMLQKKA